MTRFIHDQFAKDYLEELLKPFGEVQAASQVAGEIREIELNKRDYKKDCKKKNV